MARPSTSTVSSTEPERVAAADALQRLIGADQLALYAVCRRAGTLEALPGWGGPAVLDVDVLDLLRRSAGDPGGEPAWLVRERGPGGAALAVVIARRDGRPVVMLAEFANGDPPARRRVNQLLPSLLALIGHHAGVEQRLRSLEAENEAAVAALDHGECAIVAVTAAGKPVFMNAAARRFLAAGAGLQLRAGAVRPTGYAEAVRFRAALEEIADDAGGAPAGGRRRALAMLLPRPDGGRPAILTVAPARSLPEGAPARADQAAAAILYILDSRKAVEARVDAVCRLHGLSRVETGLIARLIGGLPLSAAAAEMQIKVETARAYLKQVFAKTGTHRQVDLVALLSRYSRAMRGDFDFQPA